MLNPLDHCSFCGKAKESVKKLIVGENVAICDICVNLCQELLETETETKPESVDTDKLAQLDPVLVKEFLDQYVISQTNAKIILAVAVINHYKRINNVNTGIELDKSNIMIIGPTGTGKTLLARSLARYLDVPFAIADATSVTEAGYVGDDVESIIIRLLNNANGDVEKAQCGIIYIDEIDKIARKGESASITRDVSGEGVQQALLKLVEGTVCRVPPTGGRKHPSADMVEIDTKNILFIAGGAFVGLENIVQKREQGTSIGFGATMKSASTVGIQSFIPDDIIRFGMIPEFIGRFPVAVTLDNLTHDDFVSILTDSKNNLIIQYQYLFRIDDVDLEFAPDGIDAIVDRAMASKTGARALQTELERVLVPHMFHLARYKKHNINQVVIDRNMVNNPYSLMENSGEKT